MRRALVAAGVAAVWLAAPADGHPGHATPIVTVANHAYSPQVINVVEGDVVQWNFDETGHSVTSDPSSSATFDSGVVKQQGGSYQFYFATPGTYAYHCSVHADMHGTVVVAPNPNLDTTPPVVSKVRLHASRRTAVLTFSVSEDVSVTTRVRRAGKVVRHSFRFVSAGRARTSVSVRGLPRGRYRVAMVAEDPTGNKSKTAVVGFRR